MFALPADTMNTAVVQLPLTILASRFGAETAGFVALAFRTLSAPIALLGTAVLEVFKRRASESWRAIGSCRGPFVETFLVLAAGSLVATVIFGLAGEQLFVLAFGERWREAGTAGVILLPLFALRFVASPLSFTFYIAEKQHIDLIWQIGLFAMTLMTLTQFEHYQSALKAYALGYGFFYLIYVALSYRFSAGKRA
jgi:O-antigen/teichoic acid export membrane protein